MKKWIVIILVLLVVAAAGLYFSLETIVKKAVNKYGSEVTQTQVTLGGFKLSLANGDVHIQKVLVANPEGYSAPYLFELDEVHAKIDIKSLMSDTIVVEVIEVTKPVITYEMKSVTQNNINDIMKNVSAYGSKSPKTEPEKKAEPEKPSSEPGKKVVIKKVSVDEGQINAITVLQSNDTKASVKLPVITLTGIGEEKKGESAAHAISRILTQILTVASKTVVESGLSDLKNVAQENLDNVVGGVKERVGIMGLFGGK